MLCQFSFKNFKSYKEITTFLYTFSIFSRLSPYYNAYQQKRTRVFQQFYTI